MSDPASIQHAIAQVMADLPAIGKTDQASPQQGGYRYRGIEAITSAAQPLFAKHGVVIVPTVTDMSVRDITVNNKPWTDTTLTVNYTLTGPDGSQLTACCVGIGRDNSDKGANKAMTQAFKYLLLQVLCISDSRDDADGTTHEADHHHRSHNPQVDMAVADFGRLDETQRDALKAWADGRSLAPAALAADPDWCDEVQAWLDRTLIIASGNDQ